MRSINPRYLLTYLLLLTYYVVLECWWCWSNVQVKLTNSARLWSKPRLPMFTLLTRHFSMTSGNPRPLWRNWLSSIALQRGAQMWVGLYVSSP